MLDLVGKVLKGRYRIEGLIGRGGMAEVYKAWDTGRQYHVAIKVMREDLAEDIEFLRRFKREAQALAALSHANIVRFYSFEREERLAFIVMDYVEGDTLRGRIVDSPSVPLPLDEVAAATRQICAALHYAHQENVLHRDVKPGNIMIRPDGQVLVTDFGIAKAADSATATTVMPGTPAYMSPEQCRSEPLDERTDLYSLGIMVYEMLAGRRPFVGETARLTTGSTREKIRWEQMNARPPPLRQPNPAVPAEMERVLLQALAKEREERWQTMLAFWGAFQAALPTGLSPGSLESEVTPAGVLPSEPGTVALDEESRSTPGDQASHEAARPFYARFPPWVWLLAGLILAVVAVVLLALGARANDRGRLRPTTEAVTGSTETRPPSPTATPLSAATVDDLATEVVKAQAVASTLTAAAPTDTPIPSDTPTQTPTGTPSPTSSPSATATSPTPSETPTSTPTPTTPTPLPFSFLDDFETYGSDGALNAAYSVNDIGGANTGQLRLAFAPNTYTGGTSAAFHFDIKNPYPDDYAGFERTFTTQDWRPFRSFCVWVRSSGGGWDLVIQFREDSGEFWRYRVKQSTFGDRDFCLPLNEQTFEWADWSAAENGRIDRDGIDYYGFFVGHGDLGSGTIYVDSIRLEP